MILVSVLSAVALDCTSMAVHDAETPAVAVATLKDVPPQSGPDCHGFGGKIHGATTCVRVDLGTDTVQPLTVRPMPGPDVVSARCGEELRSAHTRVRIVCDSLSGGADAGSSSKPVIVSAEIAQDGAPDGASPRRVRLDRFDAFWDFVNVWVRERDRGLDMAIDYAVLD
jgi:hypothetical protein